MTRALRLDPAQGLVRGVRAAVLTVPAVGSAALAHSSAGGCTSVLGLVLAAGLCWPAAVAVLGARRRTAGLVVWLGLAQALTHALLEQFCPEVRSGALGLLEHLVMSLTPGMLAVHVGAALLTALLLGRADAGLWTAQALLRAGHRARGALARLAPVVLPVFASPVPVLPVRTPCPRPVWQTMVPVRRGPPALLSS